MLEALDARRKRRAGARRHEDMARRDFAPAGEAHPLRPDDRRPLLDQLRAGGLEIGAIGGRQAGDLLLLGRNEARPVESGFAHTPAKPGRVGEFVGEAARVDVEFLGNAAANDAGAADPALLRHDGFRAVAGRDPRCADPAGPGADDEEVDVERHSAAP